MAESHKRLPLGKLFLDDQNPRLPSHLKGAEESEIISYMLMEAATLDLMTAIGQNGFFDGEPLLVVHEKGRYRVIEGNRRLTALKLLKDPALAPVKERKVEQIFNAVTYKGSRIKSIPCQVFSSEEPIHKYLGYRHITGVQSWDLTQKAAFLSEIRSTTFPSHSLDDASREMAKMIGSRKDYVKRLLIGYEVFLAIRDAKYFRIAGLSETSFYFNYIADSLSRENIAAFLGIQLDAENPIDGLKRNALKQWTHWFFEKNDENQTRIKATAEQLKWLNAVLANERAFDAFSNDGKRLREAYELTAEIDEVFFNCITAAVNSLETADALTHKLSDFYGSLDEDLQGIMKLVRKIKSASEEDVRDDA